MRLIRHGAARSTLVAVFHHIIWDESSLGVFERELGELYAAALAGREPQLAQLPVQYADYSSWQQETPQQRHLDYWAEQLRGAPPITALPTDRPRSEQDAPRGAATASRSRPGPPSGSASWPAPRRPRRSPCCWPPSPRWSTAAPGARTW